MPAAPVEKFAGSITLTASEQTLAETGGTNDLGTSGVFVLRVDLANLANGDIVEIRGYSKVRTADSIRQEWLATRGNIQGSPNQSSVALVVTAYGKFTIVQTAHPSSFKAVPWSVMQL